MDDEDDSNLGELGFGIGGEGACVIDFTKDDTTWVVPFEEAVANFIASYDSDMMTDSDRRERLHDFRVAAETLTLMAQRLLAAAGERTS